MEFWRKLLLGIVYAVISHYLCSCYADGLVDINVIACVINLLPANSSAMSDLTWVASSAIDQEGLRITVAKMICHLYIRGILMFSGWEFFGHCASDCALNPPMLVVNIFVRSLI